MPMLNTVPVICIWRNAACRKIKSILISQSRQSCALSLHDPSPLSDMHCTTYMTFWRVRVSVHGRYRAHGGGRCLRDGRRTRERILFQRRLRRRLRRRERSSSCQFTAITAHSSFFSRVLSLLLLQSRLYLHFSNSPCRRSGVYSVELYCTRPFCCIEQNIFNLYP